MPATLWAAGGGARAASARTSSRRARCCALRLSPAASNNQEAASPPPPRAAQQSPCGPFCCWLHSRRCSRLSPPRHAVTAELVPRVPRAPPARRCAMLGLRAGGCKRAGGGGGLGAAGRGRRRSLLPPPLLLQHPFALAGWMQAPTPAARPPPTRHHSPPPLQGQTYCPPYAATYTTAAQCDAAILSGVQAAEALGIELAKHGFNAGQNSTAESGMLTSEHAGGAATAAAAARKAVPCGGGYFVAPAAPPPSCSSNRCRCSRWQDGCGLQLPR